MKLAPSRASRNLGRQPSFEIGPGVEIRERFEKGERAPTLVQSQEQALHSVFSAPGDTGQLGIDRAIEGQEIKAAIGCWADHNAVGIVGEMAQGRAQMIHRELGAVRPNDDRRLPSGLRLDGPDGALESLSKGPACLFDLLRARGQVERRWCRHSAITSSRTPCGENRFQALLVEPPLGTLQPRGQQAAAALLMVRSESEDEEQGLWLNGAHDVYWAYTEWSEDRITQG